MGRKQKEIKSCPRCDEMDVAQFGNDRRNLDGLRSYCKVCSAAQTRKSSRSFNGIAAKSRNIMKNSAEKRGRHIMFTLDEFKEWLYAQGNFKSMFDEWVASEYSVDLYPGTTRVDAHGEWTLDNLVLSLHSESMGRFLGDADRNISGRNKSPVDAFKEGLPIGAYQSIVLASKATGVGIENIKRVLRGRGTTAGGYGFKYSKI